MTDKGPKKAALIFIFITVLLDMIALGIVIPVLPKLIENFLSGNTAAAARMLGYFGTIWALMQFVFSPILGMASDRFGRRPVILLSNFGLALDYILMALAPSVGLLFAGRVLSGITTASIPAAGSYIADVSPPEKRAEGFGMLGMAFGIGFVLGPALGGILGDINPRLPFWAAGALSLANTLYGFFVLPESLARENRSSFSWAKANPVGSLTLLKSHTRLLSLSVVNFLQTLAHVVLPSIFVLYASYRYGWSAKTVGLWLALVGVTNGLVQGALIRPSIQRFGEQTVLLIGMFFGFLGFLAFGLAPSGNFFWMGVPLLALWGLSGAALQGMLTELVSATEQGQLQGAMGSIRGVAEMVGPALFTFSFSYVISRPELHLPGAPFFVAAALMALSIGLAFAIRPRVLMVQAK